MKQMAGLALAAVFLAAYPAAAAPPKARALFKVEDVDRDTVPAGTPEAFWAAFGKSPKNEAVRTVDQTDYTYVPLALIPLPDGKTALIGTGASECTGHACSGLNSVHYLERDADQARYKAVGEWLDVGTAGTFGNPALRWGWTNAIATSPVLYTEGGGTWQGYSCSYATLTELGPKGPVDIAGIPVSYSNSGATEKSAIELEGEITAAEKGRSFTVTYTGSKTFSERYERGADGKFHIVGKSRMPEC